MKNQESTFAFDRERASSYDERFTALAPLRDALHLLIRLIFSELPANAHILCVGAGTGAELIYLAQNFPQWRFAAVEPATAMLDICRQKSEECGIASRCTFHQGYLDSLPASDYFDGATCLLVSHFMIQEDERSNFFQKIAARLHPHAYLVSSDLACDMDSLEYQNLLTIWLRMLIFSQVPVTEIDNICAGYGKSVALLSPQIVESIIAKSGFEKPILFYQNLLIHAWYARRSC
jgi:tRNA (cmo5U34)-methyltransferase